MEGVGTETRVKIKLFLGRVTFYQGVSYYDNFPGNAKYRKLLCCKQLFSCELSKTDPNPILSLSQKGLSTSLGGRIPTPRECVL